MADEVNVTDANVLRAYAGKLGEFREVTITGCGVVFVQAKRIKAKMEEQMSAANSMLRIAEERVQAIQGRYQNAFYVGLPENGRDVVGESDLRAAEKKDIIDVKISEMRRTIRNLETKLDNICEKTKIFGSQMNEMCTRSKDMLNQSAELIEQYKATKASN